MNHSLDVGYKFNKEVLSKFWNDYHIFCWNNKSNFASFQGNDLALFIANGKRVSDYLEHNFVNTCLRNNITSSLLLLSPIFSFLSITYIIPSDNQTSQEYYDDRLKEYIKNVTQLYKLGADSFLTKGNTKGNDKSFYFHVLRFYIPQIAKATFE